MDRPRPGMRRRLSEAQMRELAEIVETGPDRAVDGVVRWRRVDLKRVIEERFGVVYSERTITDLLAALSFSYISGRPKHPAQDERVIKALKNLWPAPSARGREAASDQSAQTHPVSRAAPVAKMELRALRSS